jgi:hypothetical protein
MVVLEMVHEVSAVSFHLLIACHSAEHNLGETFTKKMSTFKLFPFAQYCSNQFCPFLLLILFYKNRLRRSRSCRVLNEKIKKKKHLKQGFGSGLYVHVEPPMAGN